MIKNAFDNMGESPDSGIFTPRLGAAGLQIDGRAFSSLMDTNAAGNLVRRSFDGHNPFMLVDASRGGKPC